MSPSLRTRTSTTAGTGLPPRSRGARTSRRSRSFPRNLFFTRERGTNWFPEPMPSCSWTRKAGKNSSRHGKLLRGDEWGTCNLGEKMRGYPRRPHRKNTFFPFPSGLENESLKESAGRHLPSENCRRLRKRPRMALWERQACSKKIARKSWRC